MNNFHRIAQNINVPLALLSVWQNAHLFDQFSLRTKTAGTPHKEVSDIWLRMNDLDKCQQAHADERPIDHRESIDYPAWSLLPALQDLIFATMTTVRGKRLGRCFVSKMKPGAQIYPHKDIGDDLSIYYDNEPYYSRFHIVLQGLPGSIFICGDEKVNMVTGEVWSFKGDIEHAVINNSADDRIHLVCDIQC